MHIKITHLAFEIDDVIRMLRRNARIEGVPVPRKMLWNETEWERLRYFARTNGINSIESGVVLLGTSHYKI